MKRFFNPRYVLFSARLASKAFLLKRKYEGKSPLDVIKDLPRNIPCSSFNHLDYYHALSYFDYTQCKRYYQAYSDHVTVDFIRALVYYNETNRQDEIFIQQVDDCLKKYAEVSESYCKFNMNFKSDIYTFKKDGFLSGIVQGKGISLLVRAYKVTGDPKYRELARKSIEACKIPIENHGAFRLVNKLPWIEEYPDLSKPSMVLNGHLFLLIGLTDYSSFTGDKQYDEYTNQLIASTLSYLPHYRHDDDLLYELGRWKFCNVHYLAIMTPLLEHVYQQTAHASFQEFAALCKRRCDWKLFYWLIKNRQA